MRTLALLALCALLAAPLVLATDGELLGRQLLQAQSGNSTRSGPKTAIVINMNTDGVPVYCVNITRSFQNITYKASGSNKPSSNQVLELAKLVCSDYQAAGQKLLDLVKPGGTSAQEAVQALRVAKCQDPNYVANSVTVASILAQDKASGVPEVEDYLKKMIAAMQATGIPGCATLLVSDAQGVSVAREDYFKTS